MEEEESERKFCEYCKRETEWKVLQKDEGVTIIVASFIDIYLHTSLFSERRL